MNLLSNITTGFYFVCAILILVSGIIGYSRFKRPGWMVIVVSGAFSILGNALNFITFTLMERSGSGMDIYFSVARILFFMDSLCMVIGLMLLANDRIKKNNNENVF